MADVKITALTAISSNPVNPATFPIPMVDLLDNTITASGTTKKVTVNQILGAGGTATLASATITGDLTVDTSTLKVDSTNNRVGIGTASPAVTLDVAGPIRSMVSAGTPYLYLNNGTSQHSLSNVSDTLSISVFSAEQMRIASLGVFNWYDGLGGTRMTLNSTGLGIGGSPSYKLSAVGTTNNQVVLHVGNTAGSSDGDTTNVVRFAAGSGANALWANARYDGFSHAWRCNSTTTQAMTLDASGNLLVGTTSNLHTTQGFKILASGRFFGVMASGGYAIMNHTSGAGTEYIYEFQRANVAVGSITTTTTSTAYVTSSDYRLKEFVKPLTGGLARVSALKPSTYKWKSNSLDGEGFIAHELSEVVPSAVSGDKDATNEDGSIKPQGVDLSKLVPILVAAIQELTARVQTLEAR